MQFKQGLNLLVILGEKIFLKTHIAGIITEGKNWTGTAKQKLVFNRDLKPKRLRNTALEHPFITNKYGQPII